MYVFVLHFIYSIIVQLQFYSIKDQYSLIIPVDYILIDLEWDWINNNFCSVSWYF